MAIDSGATAWVLASTALVMIMTPGVGLFYGGLVRKKNFINMITLSFVAFALVSIQWVLFGYSLAFGPDVGGFIGNLQYLGLNNVGMEPGPYSPVDPGTAVHGLPARVCDGDHGHRDLGICRADQVQLVPCLRGCSGPRSSMTRLPTGSGAAAGPRSSARSTLPAARSSTSVQGLRHLPLHS